MKDKSAIILQARMGSSRLPGKMKMAFAQGETLLGFILERVKKAGIPTIVATSTAAADDEVAEISKEKKLDLFRGDEADVLQRFVDCAHEYGLKNIIRVCGDNPFIQVPPLSTLKDRIEASNADYIGYSTSEGIPTIRTHWGFWGEAVRTRALERAAEMTNDRFYREHVTNFIYFHPDTFACEWIGIPRAIDEAKDVRLTVDTEEDLELCRAIAEAHPGSMDDPESLVKKVRDNPTWIDAMRKGIEKQEK